MALKMTYETGLFYDTKFYVFTRRNLDRVNTKHLFHVRRVNGDLIQQ